MNPSMDASSKGSWSDVASAKSGDWSLVDQSSRNSWSFVPEVDSLKSDFTLSSTPRIPSNLTSESSVVAEDDGSVSMLSTSVASLQASTSHHAAELPILHEGGTLDDGTWVDDYARRKAPRYGKKSLKHSLVKRCSNLPFQEDKIEVSRQQGGRSYGECPKSVVDDALPELLHFQANGSRNDATTLGRSLNWNKVPDLLEHLAETGKATRVQSNPPQNGYGGYANPYGRYSHPPVESYSFRVSANGHSPASEKSRLEDYDSVSNTAVYSWNRGKWKMLYELSSRPPPAVLLKHKASPRCRPLKGKLKAVEGILDGSARRAFCPGVAAVCGAASTRVSSVANAVVEGVVDLVFGNPVVVRYASVAGKIHDIYQQDISLNSKKPPETLYYQSELVPKKGGRRRYPRARIHVASEGTQAFCDRVEVSARLVDKPREWVSLGEHDACRDGHKERAIALGNVHCIALRFRAVSWSGSKPFLRVGAYGECSSSSSMEEGAAAVVSPSTTIEDSAEGGSILYTIHRLEKREDGRDDVRRRYATKAGTLTDSWMKQDARREKKKTRRDLRTFIRDVQSDKF